MADAPQPPPVAVINQAMADQFWPGDDPVGRRFRVLLSPPVTVIGVAENTRSASLRDLAGPEFYLHDLQEPQATVSVIVRPREPGHDLTRAVQTAIWSLDPDLAIASARTIEDMAEETLIVPRFTSALVGGFGAAAMVLMVVGLYGLMAFTTSARLPEMGLRLALGARPIEVVRLILAQGLMLAMLGAAAGAIGAFFLADLLDTQLYGVTPGDPLTWALVGALVLMTATLACWWPARRAGRIDPAGVLRRDGA
jgi:putative ABC transport system permease protein